MIKLFSIIIVICVMCSCVSTENVSSQFIATLNDKAKQKNKNLLFNYAYICDVKKDSVLENRIIDSFATEPIFFFEDGLILFIGLQFQSYERLRNWGIKSPQGKYDVNRWGTYSISNDTIRAIIYLGFYEKNVAIGANRLSESHFEGIITKNRILNWHLVLPLPEAANKYPLNKDYIERLSIPKNLHSINVSANLNSAKAWINKYKN